MANWAYIENNNIVETVDVLPKNWRNISNLNALENDVDFLKNLGWYPVIHNQVDYDPSTQTLKNKNITFNGQVVKEILFAEDIDKTFLYEDFMQKLKNTRDELLKKTDFMLLPDIINIKGNQWLQDMSMYRQQLRDLPNLYTDSNTYYDIRGVQWPQMPDINQYPMAENRIIEGTN
jgi:hypothetical protein